MFGELALLNDQPRRTLAVAIQPSEIWTIPKSEFMDILSSSPKFSLKLSTIISQRRHDLEVRMEGLVFKDVPSRLASQLVRLADTYGKRMGDNSIVIDIKLSQLELANLIGATRETTSTAINELKRMGVVETSHRTIVVKDLEALRQMKDTL
jgi:CRP/FNR family transcriptional regulator